MKTLILSTALATTLSLMGCQNPQSDTSAEPQAEAQTSAPAYETVGEIVIESDAGAALFPEGAVIEKLTEDKFGWSEGPVWIENGDYLLFTDVPGNVMYRWSEADGLSSFMDPSGYDGPPSEVFRESGANGLIVWDKDHILAGDHGNRAIMKINLETKDKEPLVTDYDGNRFSSPNDLVLNAEGVIYFTDPPYGLAGGDESPAKETVFNGVYRFDTVSGEISVIDDTLIRPNGVILSPDESTLYVAQSKPDQAWLLSYDLTADDPLATRQVLADMTPMVEAGLRGLPDGLAVDTEGRIYVAGPGGVSIVSPDGERLARIDTGTAAANVTFGDDGQRLYITSGPFLARVPVTTTGLGFSE